jgi:hypothetical protein
MAAKHSSKPALVAVPLRDWRDDLQDDIQDRNPLIGFGADETMWICADVLEFVCEFHLREAHSQPEKKIENGEYHVLRVVQDALKRQADVTTRRIAPKEAANG